MDNKTNLIGKYITRKSSFIRQVSMDAFDAIPSGHNMIALLEFDVTEPRKFLRILKKNGKKVSLFAFVIRSIALAISEFKELNSIRSGNKVFEFDDIDINLPIELETQGEKFPHQVVIRDAAAKSVEDIFEEINDAKKKFQDKGDTGKEDKWGFILMKYLLVFPRFLRKWILKLLINNPLMIKKMSGTTFITSVGNTASVSGFVIPYIGGPRAVSFALGSLVKKPAVINDQIAAREFLSMTIIFNHDLVDGAPAARFSNRLKKLIECSEVLKD